MPPGGAEMSTIQVAGWFLLAVLIGGMGSQCARAQDAHHHPLHEDFYRAWKQPGTGASCCNARVEYGGVEVGDCEPTKAEIRAGTWYAWLRQESRWIEVPDDKVIRERNPNGQDAHLCWSYGMVLCFLPPDVGG